MRIGVTQIGTHANPRYPHSTLFSINPSGQFGTVPTLQHVLFSMSVTLQSVPQSLINLGRQEHKKDETALTGVAGCRNSKHHRHAATHW